jgi:hypothetical protein
MTLSDYAKRVGLTSTTAWQWWKAGQSDASQLPTGTSSVREPKAAASGVALEARASPLPTSRTTPCASCSACAPLRRPVALWGWPR